MIVKHNSSFQYIQTYQNKELPQDRKIEFKNIDPDVIKWLPRKRITQWENEGILSSVIWDRHICFDPYNCGIVIPHYDINNNLIGIRERTLIKENEDKGKYMPAIINGKMYNHPLGFNLYNLNNSKENIKQFKIAIIGEGEKFCLSYASFFGEENDISVACCGSNLTSHQFELLTSLGVEEIVIAFDKQFKEIGDAEWLKWTKKLNSLHEKYSPYTKISFMFDKDNNLLKYKESPTDGGKEVFMKLFNNRFSVT